MSSSKIDQEFLNAAQRGQIKILKKQLKENNVDLSAIVNDQGETVFHLTALKGHVDALLFLLGELDPKKFDGLRNHKGETPWHVAAHSAQVDIFTPPQPREVQKIKLWNLALSKWLGAQDQNGHTVLHLLAVYDDKDQEKKAKQLTILTNLGHKIKDIVDVKDNDENTAIHLAASEGCIDTIPVLKKLKANCFATNKKKQIPLHRALLNGHSISAMKLMVCKKRGKLDTCNIEDEDGQIPLQLASKHPQINENLFMTMVEHTDPILHRENINKSIQQKVEQERNFYKAKLKKTIFFAGFCPAATLAVLFSIGAVTYLVPFVFVAVFLMLSLTRYRVTTEQYGKTYAETIHLKCQIHHLKKLSQVKQESLQSLAKQIDEFHFPEHETKQDLRRLKAELQRYKDEYKTLLSEFSFDTDPKPKYIDEEKAKLLYNQSHNDAALNHQWTNGKDRFKIFLNGQSELWCPVGAGVSMATLSIQLIAGLVAPQLVTTGVALTIGSLVISGPVGWAILSTVASVSIGIMLGIAFRKYFFNSENVSLGKINYDYKLARTEFELQAQDETTQPILKSIKRLQRQIESCLTRKESCLSELQKRQDPQLPIPILITGFAMNESFVEHNHDSLHPSLSNEEATKILIQRRNLVSSEKDQKRKLDDHADQTQQLPCGDPTTLLQNIHYTEIPVR